MQETRNRFPTKSGARITGRMNLAARLWLILLGGAIATAGAIFVWYLHSAYEKAKLTEEWIPVPAEIFVSAIDSSQRNQHEMVLHVLEVRYRYEYGGQSYTSDNIRRTLSVQSSSEKLIKRKAEKYPQGGEVTCYVNPKDPSEAILQHDTKAALYSMWFPGIFVIGGLGIVLAALRVRRR